MTLEICISGKNLNTFFAKQTVHIAPWLRAPRSRPISTVTDGNKKPGPPPSIFLLKHLIDISRPMLLQRALQSY